MCEQFRTRFPMSGLSHLSPPDLFDLVQDPPKEKLFLIPLSNSIVLSPSICLALIFPIWGRPVKTPTSPND